MSKVGFSTGKGFHDLDGMRKELGLLCVPYTFVGMRLGIREAFELPKGYTIADIVGIDFEGVSVGKRLSCFGHGKTLDDGGSSWNCFGATMVERSGAWGVTMETALVGVFPNGDNAEISIVDGVYDCSTVTNNSGTKYGESRDYIFGGADAERTIYIYFK